jgi:cytoskeletal protein CcmA (bactofilin family)
MLHSNDNAPKTQYTPSTLNPQPVKTVTSPIEQATIGRTLVIKGEVSGSESLYIDGRIEGSLTFKDHRVTVGRNGVVQANISAREVVIMGKVTGNVECSDRVDIRSEGSLTGDIVSQRISVEDGALLRGSVQLTPSSEQKHEKSSVQELPKAFGAAAGKSN